MTIKKFIKQHRNQIDGLMYEYYKLPLDTARSDKDRYDCIIHKPILTAWAKGEGVADMKWRWWRW
ncbi:MAG: hypothetical protein GY841_16555 [FCB group bacterium]|nr:hypothetical protein [FCB group bacterium]